MFKKIQFFSLFLLLGMQTIIGLIAIPVIFKYIKELIKPLSVVKKLGSNRILLIHSPSLAENIAGTIAGHLLHYVAYVNILTILILLFTSNYKLSPFSSRSSNKKNYLLIFSLILVLINEFLITPILEALKAKKSNWLHNIIGGKFMLWHSISEYIFIATLIACLIYAFIWFKDNLNFNNDF